MTKIEILDNYLGEYLKDVSPDIYVLILKAMTEYTQQQVKLFAIPVVCDYCGDTGRYKPTLGEPDGVECKMCSSK